MLRRIAVFVVVAGLLAMVAYPAFRPKRATDGMGGKRPPAVAHVEVAPATRQDIRQWISATGDVVANATVSVLSEVAGELKKLLVDEGDRVSAGQVIAQIDQEELEASYERAKAALGVMRAKVVEINAPARPEEVQRATKQLEEVRVRMQRAEADYKRQQKLFERNISSREDLDGGEMAFAVTTAQFNVAKANLELVEKGAREEEREVLAAEVKEGEAQVRQAELRLKKATIKAPISGIVEKRYFDQGAYVDTNKPIFRLVEMETVKILANVSERDIANVRPGLDTEIEVDAHAGRLFHGKVRKISPGVASDSRTAEVEIAVSNKELLLKPGMFARVRIVVGEKQGAIVVPSDAVLSRGSQAQVFVVEEGKAKLRPVTVGLSQDDVTEIAAGLNEGESVVSFGLMMLKDGMTVIVKEAGEKPPSSDSLQAERSQQGP